jgi:dCMP deaminase
MDLALSISKKSKDPKTKVGAVIVTLDNESVLSIGYNGDEKGGPNKRDSMKHGESGWIHGEINAVAKMNYLDPRGKKVYLSHSPCLVCSRVLINAGISEIVFNKEYKEDTRGLDLLRKRGIVVRQENGGGVEDSGN